MEEEEAWEGWEQTHLVSVSWSLFSPAERLWPRHSASVSSSIKQGESSPQGCSEEQEQASPFIPDP